MHTYTRLKIEWSYKDAGVEETSAIKKQNPHYGDHYDKPQWYVCFCLPNATTLRNIMFVNKPKRH